jgi:triacylglycerol lipase
MPIDNRYLAYWLGGTRREKPDVYRLASPARFVSHDDPPMFFYHGQRDALVPTLSPENMVAKLKAADVPARLVVIPDAGHVRTFLSTDATKQAVAFLDSVLKPKPTPKK